MFFDGWDNLARVAVGGLLAYVVLVVFLRFSGKRTLSKLNAFDLIVTVALGSALASALLPSQPSLADGILALALLISAQFTVAWLQVRSIGFRRLIKSQPVLLLRDGEMLEANMRRERITPDEILAALRSSGLADRAAAAAVVLETDGTLSVIPATDTPPRQSTLSDVRD